MSTAIVVDNVSKAYRLGAIGGATLKEDFSRWWAKARGKPNPLLKIGHTQDSRQSGDLYWALNNVGFEVKEGEVLGIIGGNGAGKSTLLKILSQVTAPTSGQIKIKGRIASLLEVGTGFHPELTGRENVFLNGAILGMTKREIHRKLEEIIDFSGIEEFIDTPVKRYSSGMYVRLAFAVAAHLEPEILILDEVLAVGDAQFQKKCLGKMKETGSQGRTVIFVSHNLAAVKSLCNSAISLSKGKIVRAGPVASVVDEYLGHGFRNTHELSWADDEPAPGNENVTVHKIMVSAQGNPQAALTVATALQVELSYSLLLDDVLFYASFHFRTISGECIFVSAQAPQQVRKGRYSSVCHIPANLLNTGTYTLHIYFVRDGNTVLFEMENPLVFEVQDDRRVANSWMGELPGAVRPKLQWDFSRV